MTDRKFKVYIVEDDEWFARLISHTVSFDEDYESETLSSSKALFAALKKEEAHVVTLDYRLPDASGAEVLERLKKQYPNVEVLVISEQKDVETAIDLLRAGAHDYLVKNDDLKNRLLNNLRQLKRQQGLVKRISELESQISNQQKSKIPFIGESKVLEPVKILMNKALNSDITVTVYGETGTGKEVVANYVHYHSPRADKPFVAINMASIPENLLESELFGYEKGAFTGADKAKTGKFEEANGGTLFLDEIGDVPMAVQAKLLRAIQERKIVRLGGNKEISFDCRIITATHKNLQEEVKKKNFREDLFFRLFGIQIELPALRDRGKDLELLAHYFVQKACKKAGVTQKDIEKEALKKINAYSWPGNIRELKAVMELAVVLSNETQIQPQDLNLQHEDLLGQQLKTQKTLREYDIAIVKHYLDKCDGDTKKTAEILGIGQTTVYRMLKEDESIKDAALT